MNKIAIIYGSSSGATESISSRIKEVLGMGDIFDVDNLKVGELESYNFLILGTSTTGYGDLLDSWDSFLPILSDLNFEGKKVALFGLGDSASFSSTFVDGMGVIYNTIKDRAEIVGFVSTEGYTYDDSIAVIDGKFVGLALDEDNEYDQTEARIAAWVDDLKKYI